MLTLAPTVLGARLVGDLSRAKTAALVVAFALLTGFTALWEIPLGFTPVPLTGQTFAVLLAGATLGLRAGAASQLLYLAMGAFGMPFFSGGSSGWEVLAGPTVGYLVGFVLAAAVVGRLAEAKADRRALTAVPAFALGTLTIYAFGVAGLMITAGMGFGQAMIAGVLPFLIGDAIKAGLAGLLLPAVWKRSTVNGQR